MTSFYPYSRYLDQTFGAKTYKIVVASGLTCPTRDGTLAKRGCAFCDVRGSSSFHGKQGRGADVQTQIRSRIPGIKERFNAQKFLAYFQSYTNTYSDIDYLREIYEAALNEPEISGLCIGTRPDCLPDEVLLLLEELAQTAYVSLELGVQSLDDTSLLWLDRGHDAACSLEALERLQRLAPHVHVCVHLMFGQPEETLLTAQKTAQQLNHFPIRGVKLHQLMILEHTVLAERYQAQPFETISLEHYAAVISEFLSYLRSDIYIERLYASATHPEECLAPEWSRERWLPHNYLRDYFLSHHIQQGSKFGESVR